MDIAQFLINSNSELFLCKMKFFHPQPHINLIRKLKPQTQNHFHVLLKSFSYITKNLFQATESSYRLMFHPRLPSHPKRFFANTLPYEFQKLFCFASYLKTWLSGFPGLKVATDLRAPVRGFWSLTDPSR